MNDDLISRKELKRAIDDYAEKRQDTLLWQSDIEDLIDNAPTAPLPDFKDGYKQAIIDGKTNFLRPQGEWIEVKPHQSDLDNGIDYREECSNCHEPNRHYGFDEYHDIRFATYYKTNFCPNCGAKMKGDRQ